MAVRVHLWGGEKDGQKFPSPWEQGKHPQIYYAITSRGDEELMAYGKDAPPGLKENLSILAYSFSKETRKNTGLNPDVELRYVRTPELDKDPDPPKPKPRSRSRPKKQG